MKLIASAFTAAVVLSTATLMGCANSGEHMLSIPEGAETATIVSTTKRDSFFVWIRANTVAIDHQFVEFSAWSGLPSEVKAPVGRRTIVAEVTFHRAFGAPLLTGQTRLEATLLGGQTYRLIGKVRGVQSQVWLEDEGGNQVSDIGVAELGSSAMTPLPIMIPQPGRAK